MNSWLISVLLLFAFVLVLGTAMWAVVRHTGRTETLRLPWSLVGPVGAGCAAAVAGAVFHLSPPWVMLAVGVVAGILQFVAQVVFSYRAAQHQV
jgi:TRAP-type C4-dicarboxylate transport system permease small subunit